MIMFQSEDNLKPDLSNNDELENNFDEIDANLSAKNVAARKKQIESVFIKLIAVGLAFGTVLGVGAYYLLNRLGLTKKPYQLEEKIEQEQQPNNSIEKTKSFSLMKDLREG